MELDEMKSKWQQMSEELKATRIVNEQLMQRMLTDKATTAMDKMRSYEYFGVGACCLLLLLFLLNIQRIDNTIIMEISYSIMLAGTATSLFIGIYKLKVLSQIDFSNASVIQTTDKIQRFRLLVAREKLWSILLSPFVLGAAYIVVFKWVNHRDLLSEPKTFIIRGAIALVVMIAALLIIYPKVYFARINTILGNLKEIDTFRNAS